MGVEWICHFPAKTEELLLDYVIMEFHALVVLELVRGCAITSRFFVLSAMIVYSFNSYLDLYISGFGSIGARCKLACQSVKCTFRMESFSQCCLPMDLRGGVLTKLLYRFLSSLRIGER